MTVARKNKNMNNIDEDMWVDILNGSKVPDNTVPEQIEILKIKDILLQQEEHLEEEMVLITDKQEKQYKEERKKLLKRLKHENIINDNNFNIDSKNTSSNSTMPLGISSTSKQPKQNDIRNFFLNNRLIFNFGLLTLLGVIIIPNLYSGINIMDKLLPTKNIHSATKTPKSFNHTRQSVSIYKSKNPEKHSKKVKKQFEEAGLSVELKKQNNDWLLSTDLQMPGAKRKIIVNVLTEHSLPPPIGSTQLDLLFVQQ